MIQQQQQQQSGSASREPEAAPVNWSRRISWILSIVFLLAGLGAMSYAPGGGFMYLLVGVLWFPPLNDWLKNEKQTEIPLWAKIAATIVLVMLAGVLSIKPPAK